MTEDRTLVADVLARKPRAFERLVAGHQRLVWHLVHRMVQHPEDTEELCQDVFMRAYRYLPDFRFESALSTWLGQIAFSVATRHLQKKRIPTVDLQGDEGEDGLSEWVADEFDLETSMVQADMGAHVSRALASLAVLPRTVVCLYYLEELSVGEIAKITELAEGTVKSHLFRARASLRKSLAEDMEIAA